MNFRVTFRKHDGHGIVDFERDVVADTGAHAILQAGWQLEEAHPDDDTYKLWALAPLDRCGCVGDTQEEVRGVVA